MDEFPYWAIIPAVLFLLLAGLIVIYGGSSDPTGQVNVEFFFRLLYDCLHGSCYANVGLSAFAAFAAHLWAIFSVIAYIISAVALGVIIYCTIRLFELREREHHEFGTLHIQKEQGGPKNPRWAHIEGLIQSTHNSDWRQAIIEADIMLDDVLSAEGYKGGGVGEKLRQVKHEDLDSLHDAWQAHDVRNQIAHQGSTYDLSQQLAQRTVGRYERVFNEYGII